MSGLTSPSALRLLVAFSRHSEALDWAQAAAERHWGPLALVSPRFEFCETRYYEAAMGADLRLAILAFADRANPGELALWKRQSSAWEAEYAALKRHSEPRPLNLDPGYLTLAKFVLASTKDHAHRIYLGHGVFAEITLYYKDGRWQPHPWTYPNYRRDDYQAFLSRCRDQLLAQQRKGPQH